VGALIAAIVVGLLVVFVFFALVVFVLLFLTNAGRDLVGRRRRRRDAADRLSYTIDRARGERRPVSGRTPPATGASRLTASGRERP
jgi:hypothetical protein